MMFTRSLFILRGMALLVLLILANCTGRQVRKDKGHFPTYEQIRGNKSETVDFFAPPTISNGDVAAASTIVRRDRYWNAFNYPADSTIYYLNGRKAKNQRAARKELDQKTIIVERVMIGAVATDGTREIEIDYHKIILPKD